MPKTIIIDIETTGLVPKIEVPGKRPGTTKKEQIPYDTMFSEYPYIVEIAWKIEVDGKTKNFVINQEGREIPKEASDIHGITTEIANQSEFVFDEVIKQFMAEAYPCDIVVGHGIYYDTSIIKANVFRGIQSGRLSKECREMITEALHKYKRIDTMRSTSKMMRKWPTLSELHQKIFRRGFDAHGAKEDVEATARCYEWLLSKKIVPTHEDLKRKAKEREAKHGK